MTPICDISDDRSRLCVWQYGPMYFQAQTTDKATGRAVITVFRGRFCKKNVAKFIHERLGRMQNYADGTSVHRQWHLQLPAR